MLKLKPRKFLKALLCNAFKNFLGLSLFDNGSCNQAIDSNISVYDVTVVIGVWKKLKQKMDERHIKRCPNIGHEKSKH